MNPLALIFLASSMSSSFENEAAARREEGADVVGEEPVGEGGKGSLAPSIAAVLVSTVMSTAGRTAAFTSGGIDARVEYIPVGE